MRGLMMATPLLISHLLEHADRIYGDQPIVTRAVEGPVRRSSWRMVASRARRLASALRERGIGAGDRVATLAWNTERHVEIYFAVSGLGAVCHTINPRLHAAEIGWILAHAEDVAVFVDLSFLPVLREALATVAAASVRHLVVLTDAAGMPPPPAWPRPEALAFETLLESAAGDGFLWPQFDENAAAVLCYTSGTTGRPKGVLYSHRSQVLHAYAAALPDSFSFSEADSVLPVVPMFHANAWGAPYAAALTGAKLVLPGARLDGEALATLMADEAVTLALGVPSVWLGLLNYLKSSGQRLPALRRVVIGGAPAPRPMIEAFERDLGVEVRHAWGMTEMSPLGTVCTLRAKHRSEAGDGRLDRLQKQGRPVFGVEMRLVGEDGAELPCDGETSGNLQVRGPWVCSGYFRVDGSAADAGGWFGTGDIASIDADGYMAITDRAKDMIKSGGEWISSVDLERVALEHPAVQQAAAIGVADERWGERPILVVVLQPQRRLSEAELLASFQGRVAKWSIPDRVVFVDALPLGATGKVQKNKLRELYGQVAASPRTGEPFTR